MLKFLCDNLSKITNLNIIIESDNYCSPCWYNQYPLIIYVYLLAAVFLSFISVFHESRGNHCFTRNKKSPMLFFGLELYLYTRVKSHCSVASSWLKDNQTNLPTNSFSYLLAKIHIFVYYGMDFINKSTHSLLPINNHYMPISNTTNPSV